MLTLNFSRVFKAASISNGRRFLLRMGYSSTTVQRYTHGTVSQIKLAELENLCLKLGCTPNDLLAWTPPKGYVDKNHPLRQLLVQQEEQHVEALLAQMPYEDLKEIKQLIIEKANARK